MKIYLSQKKKIFLGWYLATKHAVAFIINFIPKEEASWEIRFPNLLLPAVVYIDPRKIRLMGSVPAKPSKGCSFILDGNWDQQIVTTKESEIANPKHKSCREIIIEKMALRETAEYHMIVEKIAVSGQYRECKKEQDAYDYMLGRKTLYEEMKLGYRSQKELGCSRFLDEIQAAVGTCGELIQVNSGSHRLAAAYYLGLKQVPVHLALMHAQLFKGHQYKNRFEFLRAMRQKIKDVEARYA